MGSDDRFELEPDDPPPAKAAPAPAPAPESAASKGSAAPRVPAAHMDVTPDDPGGAPPVGARTVAERQGRDLPRVTGAVPDPPGWPREVLTFPLRHPGARFFGIALPVYLLVDLLLLVTWGYYPALVFEVLLAVFMTKAQMGVVGRSAAGDDTPAGWTAALELDADAVRTFGLLGLITLFLAVVALIAVVMFAGTFVGVVVLLLLSPYAAVALMAFALKDKRLLLPWHAFGWIARRPAELAVGAVGWWALGLAWLALSQTGKTADFGVFLIVSASVRAFSLYAVLASARVIGVVARRWTPDGYADPAEADPAEADPAEADAADAPA